jgi:poly(3-hydroxybutyrate) depolymerase
MTTLGSALRLAALFGTVLALPLAAQSDKCTALLKLTGTQLPNAATVLETATYNTARAAQGPAPAAPEHCELIGNINARVGFNSMHFAIRFHMRLPANWNGKFFFEGGGGSNGNLGAAFGNLQGAQRDNALGLGYAVVSQDSGHDNTINNDPNLNGASAYAFDQQSRLDHGYNSYDQVTQAAKALIRLYYGRAPDRSYFAGCSEGGREALLMAEKFPSHFDGILACAPGIRIPKAALEKAFDFQVLAGVAKAQGLYDSDGLPFVNKAYSDEDMALAAGAVLEACDSLDGAKDGMVANFAECNGAAVRPKLAALICKGPKRSTCLLAAQTSALERIFAGGKTSTGEPIYSDWAWDAGISGGGWRAWSMGAFDSPNVNSIATGLVGTNTSAIATPPQPVHAYGPDAAKFLLDLNPEAWFDKIRATSPAYPVSEWELMNTYKSDLAAFKARGGKLLVAHGVSDPIFSIKDTIAWYGEVDKAQNGSAAQFCRLFAVPGMNHCQGGPATDQFNAFAALVDWVENGTAPDAILATAGNGTPWPGRTRPLCAWPKIAKYKGTGNMEDAANFACQ